MEDRIEELVQRWREDPDVSATVALCEALCDRPDEQRPSQRRVERLVQQVGEFAVRRHARDVRVLVSVARMYLESGRMDDAQSVLVGAAKDAPRDAGIFRCLGEVLLRRGDAERAEKILQRAVQFGSDDPGTELWLERARGFRPLQSSAGPDAVAAQVARLAAMGPAAPTLSELATQPRAFVTRSSNPPRIPPRQAPLGAIPTAPPVARKIRQTIESSNAAQEPVGSMNSTPPAERRPVPHPRDVLEALTTAGLFEPENAIGTAAWDRAAPAAKRRGAAVIWIGIAMFLAANGGVYGFYRHKRAEEHRLAEAVLTRVEEQLHDGRPDALPEMEDQLARAFQLESRSPRAALDWARERALVGLVKGGADVAFEDAMTRAKELGLTEERYAFAQVASFLLQGDTAGAAAVLPRWDGPAANDPWYQLVAGAALERAGDLRALQRYAAASALDSQLFVAEVGEARATAIDSDSANAMRIARALRLRSPERAEPIALVALAWGRDPRREPTPAPPEIDLLSLRASELPSSLRFVPHAVRALRAADRRALVEARTAVQDGLAVAESPGAAVWLGVVALPLGDEELARKAALTALRISAGYEPARALAARVALNAGRLDEALKATEELDAGTPDIAVVRAAAAYERMDADGAARALAALSPETRRVPALVALAGAGDALAARPSMDGSKLLALADDDAPWSDLIAIDVALDEGELSTADKLAALWGSDAASSPLRALRLARLDRYEGRLDAADALCEAALSRGTVTPRGLSERVFELVARGRGADVPALLSKYPLALGPLATWLSAYAAASTASADIARGKLATVDPPPEAAPFEARVIAAAALAAAKDRRRASDAVKALLATGALHPDLVAAAIALGFRRIDHGRRRPTYE